MSRSTQLRFAPGEVAWVTGASSGIGLQLAKALAQEGVTVVLTARRAQALDAALQAIRDAGGSAYAQPADVAVPESLKDASAWIKATLGRCDMVAPLAGHELLMPLEGMSVKRWRSILDVHVVGAMETVRYALPLLRSCAVDDRQGRVVFLSSAAALKGWSGQTAYAAAKGAQIAGMRCMAAELAPAGIRVNAVAAGIVETPMQQRMFARIPEGGREDLIREHPLGLGSPDSVVDALLFLLSRESRWITGACLAVDGGLGLS